MLITIYDYFIARVTPPIPHVQLWQPDNDQSRNQSSVDCNKLIYVKKSIYLFYP